MDNESNKLLCIADQLRVFWRNDVEHHDDDPHHDFGIWVAATMEAKREAATICQVQNAIYGKDTHWIEGRMRLGVNDRCQTS